MASWKTILICPFLHDLRRVIAADAYLSDIMLLIALFESLIEF